MITRALSISTRRHLLSRRSFVFSLKIIAVISLENHSCYQSWKSKLFSIETVAVAGQSDLNCISLQRNNFFSQPIVPDMSSFIYQNMTCDTDQTGKIKKILHVEIFYRVSFPIFSGPCKMFVNFDIPTDVLDFSIN